MVKPRPHCCTIHKIFVRLAYLGHRLFYNVQDVRPFGLLKSHFVVFRARFSGVNTLGEPFMVLQQFQVEKG